MDAVGVAHPSLYAGQFLAIDSGEVSNRFDHTATFIYGVVAKYSIVQHATTCWFLTHNRRNKIVRRWELFGWTRLF